MKFHETFQQGCFAMLKYLYETNSEEYFNDAYGKTYPNGTQRPANDPYRAEKQGLWELNHAAAIGQLDEAHTIALFELIEERYGKDVRA